MEMMCAGLPIISSARGGSAEILENGVNSLFYQAGNINGLAAKILYLVEHYNDIAEALGQNARRNIIENFNSAKINQKIISFITSVFNRD